jgi:hypothetical protein
MLRRMHSGMHCGISALWLVSILGSWAASAQGGFIPVSLRNEAAGPAHENGMSNPTRRASPPLAFSGVLLSPLRTQSRAACLNQHRHAVADFPHLGTMTGSRRNAKKLCMSSGGQDQNVGEDNLRNEMESLLSSSGRSSGMKKLKAPKGTRAPAPSSQTLSRSQSPDEQDEPATMEELLRASPVRSPLRAPPARSVAAPSTSASEPKATLVKPSYASGGVDDVLLIGLSKGDTVPVQVWGELQDSDGNPVRLNNLGDEKILIIAEPAHHTGAASDSWTRLLNDIGKVLGRWECHFVCVCV